LDTGPAFFSSLRQPIGLVADQRNAKAPCPISIENFGFVRAGYQQKTTRKEERKHMSETFPGSISTETLINFWKRHIYLLPSVHAHGTHSEPHPDPWRLAAINIISLLNLKDLTAKLRTGGDYVKGIDAELSKAVDAAASFPDPDGSDGQSHPGSPSFSNPWLKWHGPIPPGPLLIALELNAYAKTVGDERFFAVINDVIGQITTKTGVVKTA
jgi:hypothetical protein